MLITRLIKRKDFLLLSNKGQKIVTRNFIFIYLYNEKNIDSESKNFAKIGFTASKKIGNAVKRNRAKRLMKAIVRIVFEPINVIPSNIVLIARSTILKSAFTEIVEDLEYSTNKIILEEKSYK